MAVVYTYECPDCGKTMRDVRHVVDRHVNCPASDTPKLYVLVRVEVE